MTLTKTPMRRDVAWAVAVIALAIIGAADPRVGIACAGAVLAAGVWTWPDLFMQVTVFAVLAVRPSLDMFSDHDFGVGPFSLNPAVLFGLCVLFVAIVLLVRRACYGAQLWPTSGLLAAHFWLATAYAIALITGWLFYDRLGLATGTREAIRMLSIVASFWLVTVWVNEDPGRYARGWAYLILGSLSPITLGLWQLLNGTGYVEPDGLTRLVATFSHPNSFGPYLVPLLLLAIAKAGSLNGRKKVPYFAAALVSGTLIVFTYSRTAMLAAIVGLALLPILQARHLGARFMARGVLAAICFLGVSWLIAGDTIRNRFQDISFSRAAIEAAQSGESENSFQWRLINWGVLVSLGTEHPLVGHGAGMTMVLNPLVSPVNGVPFNAHNDFVRWFFEGGTLGLFCYVLYCVLLCRWAVREARRIERTYSATAFATAAAWLALLLLSAGTPEISLQTAVQYQLYGLLALLSVGHTAHVIEHQPEAHNSATAPQQS